MVCYACSGALFIEDVVVAETPFMTTAYHNARVRRVPLLLCFQCAMNNSLVPLKIYQAGTLYFPTSHF
jgi:hypothetical protein